MDAVGSSGNLLLDRAVGAKITIVPNVSYEKKMTEATGNLEYATSTKSLNEMVLEYAENLK